MDQSNPSLPLTMSLMTTKDCGSHLPWLVSAEPLKRNKTHDRDDVEEGDLRLRKRVLTASPVRRESER